MRCLTPYNHPNPLPRLLQFYRKRYRGGRDLYAFRLGYRPGAAPTRRSFWARLFGRG